MRWHFQNRLMSENGGGADILRFTSNRPLLTQRRLSTQRFTESDLCQLLPSITRGKLLRMRTNVILRKKYDGAVLPGDEHDRLQFYSRSLDLFETNRRHQNSEIRKEYAPQSLGICLNFPSTHWKSSLAHICTIACEALFHLKTIEEIGKPRGQYRPDNERPRRNLEAIYHLD